VFMVGEIGWGEKGVPKLLGTRRSGCITEKRFSRRRFEKKKKFQKFRKTSPPPKVKFLGKPRNTSVNVLAIGRLYIYEYIFYILFFESSCYASVIFLAEYERSRLAL